MKKFLILMLVLILIAAAFSGGYLLKDLRAETEKAQLAAANIPELRVFDGNIEWKGGGRWHILCSVEQLGDADPIALAQKAAAELAEAELAAAETEETGDEEVAEEESSVIFGLNRGSDSVARSYGGGGGAGGGGGGGYSGGDGEDISWSSDYL